MQTRRLGLEHLTSGKHLNAVNAARLPGPRLPEDVATVFVDDSNACQAAVTLAVDGLLATARTNLFKTNRWQVSQRTLRTSCRLEDPSQRADSEILARLAKGLPQSNCMPALKTCQWKETARWEGHIRMDTKPRNQTQLRFTASPSCSGHP